MLTLAWVAPIPSAGLVGPSRPLLDPFGYAPKVLRGHEPASLLGSPLALGGNLGLNCAYRRSAYGDC